MIRKLFLTSIVAITAVFVAFAQPRPSAVGKDVTVLGFKLHYLEAGRGAPVVLLHGLGGDGSRWGPNIEPHSRAFHVFRLDHNGFGQDGQPLANYHNRLAQEYF